MRDATYADLNRRIALADALRESETRFTNPIVPGATFHGSAAPDACAHGYHDAGPAVAVLHNGSPMAVECRACGEPCEPDVYGS